MSDSFISIIIPAFNRATIINDTLNSIKAQSYTHWECLVIDDGSDDETVDLIYTFIDEDNRFRLYKRPLDAKKGANTCRNIGLHYAKGDYIVFFDSDDLMTINHLDVKLKAIKTYDADFVVTKTKYFNYEAGNLELRKNYEWNDEEINLFNYVAQNINWLTLDIIIKSRLSKSIEFNTNLNSGQEYNYFSKLLTLTVNGKFIDEVVSLRRHHENSIQGTLRKDKDKIKAGYFKVYLETYNDIKDDCENNVRQNLVYKCYKLCVNNAFKISKNDFKIMKNALIKEFNFMGLIYRIILTFKAVKNIKLK